MSEKTLPKVYSDVPNWWYHYYSIALDKKIRDISEKCFLLHPHKSTPDFVNCRYNYGICHPQIGKDVIPGKSIIVLKTTIGSRNVTAVYIQKTQFITGYFRVHSINRDEKYIVMDKEDSLLLLGNPIRINVEWVKRLFPEKTESYWAHANILVQKVGSMTRNRHIKKDELILVLQELYKRKNEGAINFLGQRYACLCSSGRKQTI